jgi:hypothetical protein
MVLTPQKPTQRTRVGERPEGLPGSTLERGMRGEKRQELGRPHGFLGTGRPYREDGQWFMGSRITSEYSEGGRAVHRGKGVTVGRSPHRTLVPDMKGRRTQANLPEENSKFQGNPEGRSEFH